MEEEKVDITPEPEPEPETILEEKIEPIITEDTEAEADKNIESSKPKPKRERTEKQKGLTPIILSLCRHFFTDLLSIPRRAKLPTRRPSLHPT